MSMSKIPAYLEDTKDEAIEPFTVTPSDADDYSPNDVDEMEETIKEDEEQTEEELGNDEQLSKLMEFEIDSIRITQRFNLSEEGIYATEDVGDVIILDEDIKEVESEDDAEGDLGGDISEETDTEETPSFSKSLKQYVIAAQELTLIPATESSESWEEFKRKAKDFTIKATKFLGIRLIKYTRSVYLFTRNKLSKSFLRMETIHKLWKFKLERNMINISKEDTEELSVTAVPWDVMKSTMQVIHHSSSILKSPYSFVFNTANELIPSAAASELKHMTQVADIKEKSHEINISKLLEERTHDSLNTMGFGRETIPNLLRMAEDIGKLTGKQAIFRYHAEQLKTLNEINKQSIELEIGLLEKKIKADSKEYQQRVERMALYTARWDLFLTYVKCQSMIIDVLSTDILRVFSKYEDAIDPSLFVRK